MNKKLILGLLLTFTFLLAACNATTEEGADAAFEKMDELVKEQIPETNETIGHYQLYVPEKFEMKEEVDEFNILFEKGKNPYILFVNPNEDERSKQLYETTIEKTEGEITKVYEQDGQFMYVIVTQLDDNRSELTVGVGGRKLTTYDKNKKLAKAVEPMVQLIRSLEIMEEENDVEPEEQPLEELKEEKDEAA